MGVFQNKGAVDDDMVDGVDVGRRVWRVERWFMLRLSVVEVEVEVGNNSREGGFEVCSKLGRELPKEQRIKFVRVAVFFEGILAEPRNLQWRDQLLSLSRDNTQGCIWH